MKKFTVTGMSCAACSSRVEKAVAALDGVQKCSVNLLTNTLVVDGEATTDDIISAVEAAGYGVLIAKLKVHNTPSDSKKDTSVPSKFTISFSAKILFVSSNASKP